MKKHLFLHLSFMGLMGLSTIAYGGWTKYGPNFKSGDPIPNGDCLEMICEHGCVEDENGLNGTCCPNDGTNGSACTIGACCKSGSCTNDGKCGCEKDTDCEGEQVCLPDKTCGCPNGSTAYTKLDNTIGCCNSTTHVLNNIENSDKKVCCPAETPKWDAEQQKCIQNCPIIDLYSYKTLAEDAARDIGVFDVDGGTIGPYECDYRVVMPWWSVDDTLCIQGESMACQEPQSQQGRAHTVCPSSSPSCSSLEEKFKGRIPIDNPEVAYILPAGKQIKFKMINKRLAAGGGNNSALKVSVRLEPITEGQVKEQCGGGWFTRASSGSCDALGCQKEITLKKNQTASGVQEKCCTDEGANKVVDTPDGKVCCPIGRYQKLTVAQYKDDQKVSEETTETCCSQGYGATDSGCCKSEDIYFEGDTPKCRRQNCPNGYFWNIITQQCTECLTYYGNGEGACKTTDKPLCNISTWTCEPCPEGYKWNDELKQCYKEETIGAVCFETEDMKCLQHGLGGMITVVAQPIEKILKGGCRKGYCGFANVNNQPYVNVRAMYKDLTPSTGVKLKHLHIGNNPSNWGFTVDLTQANKWSEWKKIQLYSGPENGHSGTPSWKAFGGVQAPAIGSAFLSDQCQVDDSNTIFHATVCLEYKFEGDPIVSKM